MTLRRVQTVGDFIVSELNEPQVDELASRLNTSVDVSPAEIRPEDVALAGWSNWGARTFENAVQKSSLNKNEFILLHDWFDDIYQTA